jgi:predicted nucleotidyltransferase/DNA-binding XRE family transcriptional regulator
MMGAMDAAAIIKDARARAGLTQAALARAAGTSQPTLAAYESGAKSPSVRTLDKIVRAAGFSLDAVLHSAPPAGGAVLVEIRTRQAEIRTAAAGYGIRNVRVFGSAARCDARPDSDVDLLVDFDAERHGLGPLAGFRAEVRGLLDRDVDVATLALLRDDVRAEAEAQAVPL